MSSDRTTVGIAHIGIAVENLEAASQTYAKLFGCEPSPVEEVETEGVRVCFFELANCRIELLEGTRADSPITKFLARGGRGVHHLAFSDEAVDLRSLLRRFTEAGVPLIDDKVRPAAEDREAFFVHPRGAEGVLVEFMGKRPGHTIGDQDQDA